MFLKVVCQHLGVTLFCSVSDGKNCCSVRKSISTSEWHVEHLLAGQNTQHPKQTPKIYNAVHNIKYARHENIKDTNLQEGF